MGAKYWVGNKNFIDSVDIHSTLTFTNI